MKIILSRKGFDSKHGGVPSIIYDNKFVSFPIPEKGGGTAYKDLIFDSCFRFDKVLEDLGADCYREQLHLDPDLRHSAIENRLKKWRPAFGQEGSAQGVLKKCGVEKDDIFLFFGWFRDAAKDSNAVFSYRKDSRDIHAIFGYLQVDKVINVDRDGIPVGLIKHPHIAMHESYDDNYLYVAREYLSFDNTKPGYGTFEFDNRLVLTKKGENRSVWELPPAFLGEGNSFNIKNELKRLPNNNVELRVKGIGSQEMYVSSKTAVVDWAKSLVAGCKTYL